MISLIVWLAIIGFLTYLITSFVPMPGQIKTLIVVVAVIFCLLIVLQAFGLLDGSLSLPRVTVQK